MTDYTEHGKRYRLEYWEYPKQGNYQRQPEYMVMKLNALGRWKDVIGFFEKEDADRFIRGCIHHYYTSKHTPHVTIVTHPIDRRIVGKY